MARILIKQLSFSYPGGEELFRGVTLSLDTVWKLGLVGRNGRGKTTFLKLLAGESECRGVECPVPCRYFPFPYRAEDSAIAQAEREGVPEWRLRRETALLSVTDGALMRPFSTLSNGERTKVQLALLFSKDGGFYLLDEPTNHLDAEGKSAAAEYLLQKSGFILVSHDEALLRAVTDHTLSLERCTVTLEDGGYGTFVENRARKESFELSENDRLTKKIHVLTEAAKEKTHWAEKAEGEKLGGKNSKAGKKSGLRPDRGFLGAKAAKVMQGAKNFEARAERAIAETSALLKNVEKEELLSIKSIEWRGGNMATFDGVEIKFGASAVCLPFTLKLAARDKYVLVGKNGAGKTSLLKLILGENVPHTGKFFRAAALTVSYLPQNTAELHGEISQYAASLGAPLSAFYTILKKLGVERGEFQKRFEELSAGQKKKAALAAALSVSAHLYLLDEPTNDLDIYAKRMLKQVIRDSNCAFLIIGHDENFAEEVGAEEVAVSPSA